MPIQKIINEPGQKVIKIWTDDIEDEALNQAKNLAGLPFIAGNGVVLMPDVHAGKGSTVGSVIATRSAIIPAAVSTDIGCGMNAVCTSLTASDLPDDLKKIRLQIERDVPLGSGGHHRDNAGRISNDMISSFDSVASKLPFSINNLSEKIKSQMGTLGSGNHFIEICLDETDRVWIMLHSGSRGIGNMIGSHYIKVAQKEMQRWFINLPDRDLAYLPEGSQHFDDYIEAMLWAQDYALENRRQMMSAVIAAMTRHISKPFNLINEAVNSHHNFATKENHFGDNVWITRKGAVRARSGEMGIIPGSMGTKSYIVRGKGNSESYCSCSHGAGRKMSRTRARATFTVDDLKAQTLGVECRKDSAILDEIPGSYKDIDQVILNSSDLIEVVHTLKAVLCVKGS